MEILIIFLVVMVMANVLKKAAPEAAKLKVEPCPPHKWSYQEIKTMYGDEERITWKLVCAKCGPLKPIEVRESSDK